MSAAIHVAAVRHGQVQEGPGRRSVVWLAGCSIRCAGCINPHLFEREAFPARRVGEVLAEIFAGREQGDSGVSVVGGEPFDQPEALAALAIGIHAGWPALPGIPRLILYTGYTWDDLAARPEAAVAAALGAADVLVDGPFVRGQAHPDLGYRGSVNQRVIDLAATRAAGRLVLISRWDIPHIEVFDDGRVAMTPSLARVIMPRLGGERVPGRQCGQDCIREENI